MQDKYALQNCIDLMLIVSMSTVVLVHTASVFCRLGVVQLHTHSTRTPNEVVPFVVALLLVSLLLPSPVRTSIDIGE